MKTILLSCGSGVATSTAVSAKVKDLLDGNGFEGQYKLVQCAITEAVSKSAHADLLISTTAEPEGVECPFMSGIPFLVGIGRETLETQILDFMAAN